MTALRARASARCWKHGQDGKQGGRALDCHWNRSLSSYYSIPGCVKQFGVFVALALLVCCSVQVFQVQRGGQDSPSDSPARLRPLRSVLLEPASENIATESGQRGGENGLGRVEAFLATFNCSMNFFLAWTTPPNTFTLRYRRTIESTLLFHPEACLIVFSPTLPSDYFQKFWDLGYKIVVESPDVRALLRNTPAEKWLQGVQLWRQGPYFFSHITEIIRLATLYKYGGVYLDTDVIVMKSVASLHNCLGTEELSGTDGRVKVLNGAVLVFEKGSSFIWDCIKEFNNTYKIDSWGWNGPELVTRVARRFPQGPDLRILPVSAFYPIHWRQIHKYFEVAHFDDKQHSTWETIKEQTYIFHYWNKVTKDMVPKYGSLMYKVLNNYCILCEEKGADG